MIVQHGLNPEKCTFGVRDGKFLGFYLTERGIEVNHKKCETMVQMNFPNSKKEIHKLNGMLTALNEFISKFTQHVFPFYRLLRKDVKFEWTYKWEEALKSLKKALAIPLIIT